MRDTKHYSDFSKFRKKEAPRTFLPATSSLLQKRKELEKGKTRGEEEKGEDEGDQGIRSGRRGTRAPVPGTMPSLRLLQRATY